MRVRRLRKQASCCGAVRKRPQGKRRTRL